MAYIGVPQPSRAITSADIAQGAVTLNDISFTDMPANMDISGTIDKHTMRLAEGVTVTGDITISDNLILSKISDDGVGITLTNDSSTRTITGSGSIEASTLAQTPNASLTGMTGALGSGVTGTIGSGVTFPVGHIIQVVSSASSAYGSTTSTTYQLGHRETITPLKTNSKILITVTSNFLVGANTSVQPIAYIALFMTDNTNNLTSAQIRLTTISSAVQEWQYSTETLSYLHTPAIPSTPVPIVYGIMAKSLGSNHYIYFDDGGPCTVTLQEIAQ
jgi:hypothetical protein